MNTNVFRTVRLRAELLDAVEQFIRSHPELGYTSMANFVTDAIRRRLEELARREVSRDA